MKNIICSFLFLICLCKGVKSQDIICLRNNLPQFYKLEKSKLEFWRKDINGCFSYRKPILDSLVKNKALIGMPKSLFIILFGKPDVVSKKNDVFIYYVNCKCDKNNKHLDDSDVIQAIFIFVYDKLDSIEGSMT